LPSQQRFEGPDLEALLDDVRARCGPDAAIVEANKVRKGGVGGFFARELFEVVVEGDEGPSAGAAPSILDLADAVQDGPAEPELFDVERRGDLDEPIPPTPQSVSSDGQAFADVLDRIARSTAEPAADPRQPPVTPPEEPFRAYADVAPVADRAARRRAPARVDVDRRALARLGLPVPLVRRAPAGLDQLSTLLHLAEAFPRPRALPRTGGTVITLVGDRRGMAAAVAWAQEQLGLSPDRLVLATRSESRVFPASRRVATPQEAAEQRSSLRRAAAPTLVVVDEPVGLRSTTWARHVVDALEPAAVWGVVDAQRKAEDVAAWAEWLGGLDAIALDGTEETASPAAVLATGVPVGLLDGRTATPARWAAILDERLLAA